MLEILNKYQTLNAFDLPMHLFCSGHGPAAQHYSLCHSCNFSCQLLPSGLRSYWSWCFGWANSKYCFWTCSSSVSLCKTYYGKDGFTTFSGVLGVFLTGQLFTRVDVWGRGDPLIDVELHIDLEFSWPVSCNIKDNQQFVKATFDLCYLNTHCDAALTTTKVLTIIINILFSF